MNAEVISYGKVFRTAWEEVLRDWESGRISLENEADFSHHLFAKCLKIMEESEMPTPYKIHAESTEKYTSPVVDLSLGELEVLMEIKFEKDPHVFEATVARLRLSSLMSDDPEIRQAFFTTVKNVTGFDINGYKQSEETDLREDGWLNVQWKLIKIGEIDYCALLTWKER